MVHMFQMFKMCNMGKLLKLFAHLPIKPDIF